MFVIFLHALVPPKKKITASYFCFLLLFLVGGGGLRFCFLKAFLALVQADFGSTELGAWPPGICSGGLRGALILSDSPVPPA